MMLMLTWIGHVSEWSAVDVLFTLQAVPCSSTLTGVGRSDDNGSSLWNAMS